jgi:hypothetical protein
MIPAMIPKTIIASRKPLPLIPMSVIPPRRVSGADLLVQFAQSAHDFIDSLLRACHPDAGVSIG